MFDAPAFATAGAPGSLQGWLYDDGGTLLDSLGCADTLAGLSGPRLGMDTGSIPADVYLDDCDWHRDDGNRIGNVRQVALPPAGDGTPDAWAVSGCSQAHQCVAELPGDDGTMITSATIGQGQEFTHGTCGSTAPAITQPIHCVEQWTRAKGTGSTVEVTIDGTAVATHTLTGSFANYFSRTCADPEDDGAWTVSDLDGSEYGVRAPSGTQREVSAQRWLIAFEEPTAVLPSPTRAASGTDWIRTLRRLEG